MLPSILSQLSFPLELSKYLTFSAFHLTRFSGNVPHADSGKSWHEARGRGEGALPTDPKRKDACLAPRLLSRDPAMHGGHS